MALDGPSLPTLDLFAHRCVWDTTRDTLLAQENKVGNGVVSKYECSVNALGQRLAVATSGSAFTGMPSWNWGDNGRGEVTKSDSNGNRFDRADEFDAMGNRKKSTDSLTLPASDNYTGNALNQYTVVGSLNLAFDDDGNMISGPLPVVPDVNSQLSWDAENRVSSTTVNGTGAQYLYDALSRRIAKISGTTIESTIYNGWNVIADYTNHNLSKIYMWGADLSGTAQGAGGVGGLLAVKSGTGSFYPTYDGNGNVSEYLGGTGSIAAHFEYDAFGRTVVNSDTSDSFAYWLSTKYQDKEIGLCYYGYRYYDLTTGRWLSRDPNEEKGGVNLYGFHKNDFVNRFDYLSLCRKAN